MYRCFSGSPQEVQQSLNAIENLKVVGKRYVCLGFSHSSCFDPHKGVLIVTALIYYGYFAIIPPPQLHTKMPLQ